MPRANCYHLPEGIWHIIDYNSLPQLGAFKDRTALRLQHRKWVESCVHDRIYHREPQWTEFIAVGSECFIAKMKSQLSSKAPGREIEHTKATPM